MAKYKVLVGIDWYGGNRAEPGDVRDDIPKKSLPWLLEQGIVEPFDPKAEGAKSGAGTAPDTAAGTDDKGDTAGTPGGNGGGA